MMANEKRLIDANELAVTYCNNDEAHYCPHCGAKMDLEESNAKTD